jgi:hypothetical protein
MLKLKLMTAWALIIFAATAGAYLLVNRTVVDSETVVATDRLAHRVSELQLSMAVRARRALETVNEVAEGGPLQAALSPSPADASALQRAHNAVWPLLEGLNLRIGADLFWVVAPDGKVVARLNDRAAFGDGVKGLPVIAAALNGRMQDSLQVFNNRVMVVVGAPLVDKKNGRVIGAMLAGYELGESWIKKLSQDTGLDWSFFLRKRVTASTISDPINKEIGDILSRVKLEAGQVFDFTITDGEEVALAGRIYRFDGGLSDFDSGVVAMTRLPQPWLTPGDERIQKLLFGAFVALILGGLVAVALSVGLRRRSARVAKTVLDMRRTGTTVAAIDPKLFISEHRPYVDLLNSVIGEQLGKKDRTGIGRNDVLSTLDSMVAISEEPDTVRPAAATNGKSNRTLSSTTARVQLTPKDKAALEKVAEREVIDELAGLLKKTGGDLAAVPENGFAPPPDASVVAAVQNGPDTRPLASQSAKNRAAAKAKEVAARQSETLRPIPDADEDYFEQVYMEFLNLRDMLGQPTHNVNKEKFIQNLQGNKTRIQDKTGCRKVRFTVFEKDGKASVKAAPVE